MERRPGVNVASSCTIFVPRILVGLGSLSHLQRTLETQPILPLHLKGEDGGDYGQLLHYPAEEPIALKICAPVCSLNKDMRRWH